MTALLFVAGLSAALAASVASAKDAERPPNIVLIVVDDLGWTDLACYGSRYYETPHLDRLARDGMRFTQAYAACAVCSPTRASILTGRYPTRTGVTDWIHHAGPEAQEAIAAGRNLDGFDRPQNRPLLTPINKAWLEPEETTLAELLAPYGYASCHVGKWHLGPQGHYPPDQGFDENLGGFEVGQPPRYFDPYDNKRFDGIVGLPGRKPGEYLTDREADEAVSFIAHHQDRPFFLYLAHYAVHSPLQAKDSLIDKYKQKPKTNQKTPVYAAMIESVDDAVGRVLEALDEFGLADDTIVVFTSDNGGASHFPATDNAPLRRGKGFPYEGGIRIPWIVRYPGRVPAGAECDRAVCSVDLFPTFAEWVGAETPDDLAIDGQSVVPLLMQTGDIDRETLYWHFPHYWAGGRVKPYSILRHGDWKLIRHYEDGRRELYNIADDLGEQHDQSAERPELVEQLDAQLDELLAAHGAKLPQPNPDYQPKD